VPYGLSASIYSATSIAPFTPFGSLHGIVYVNAPTIGAETHLPIGARRNGNGHREAAIAAIDFYTRMEKSIGRRGPERQRGIGVRG